MATKSKSKSKVTVDEPVVEETTSRAGGIDKVISRIVDDGVVQPNWEAFAEFIAAHGGPKDMDVQHIGLVVTGYKYYQKSDHAVGARERAASAVAERKASLAESREANAKKRAEAKESTKAKPAAKAPAKKVAAAKKASPAKASTASAGKKPAVKRSSTTKKAKAAF